MPETLEEGFIFETSIVEASKSTELQNFLEREKTVQGWLGSMLDGTLELETQENLHLNIKYSSERVNLEVLSSTLPTAFDFFIVSRGEKHISHINRNPFGKEDSEYGGEMGIEVKQKKLAAKILILLWYLVIIEKLEQSSLNEEFLNKVVIEGETNSPNLGFMIKTFGKDSVRASADGGFSMNLTVLLEAKAHIRTMIHEYMQREEYDQRVQSLVATELSA